MNRQPVLFWTCVVSIIASCFAQATTERFTVAGVTRDYIKYVPTGISNPPFVLNIHGFNMDASSERGMCQMDRIADREKFIIAYPNALPNSSNQRSWDLSGPNDFAFLLAIIDSVDAKHHIDRSRVYACGFSQGGFMSFQLGCRYSLIFAAIAPTSGTVSGTCNLQRPVPMRLTFGTNEFERGAEQTAQFMRSVTFWVNLLHCPQTPVITRPYPANRPNSLVTRLYYGPCDGGTEVIADSVRTGGHEWPMNTSDRINNSEETWTFLQKFSLNNTAVLPPAHAALTKDRVALSYSAGVVRLQGIDDKCAVRVIDTRGRIVATTFVQGSSFAFPNMPRGLYAVKIDNRNGPVTLRMLVP